MNKCLRFYHEKDMAILKMSSHPTNRDAERGVLPTYISRVDVDESEGIGVINALYNFCESEVFMMYDFEEITDGEEYLLTLTGVHITQEDLIHDEDTDLAGYLEDLLRIQ